MSTVTVLGAHSQIFTLTYDTAANAALARQLAAAITASVKDGTLLPAVDRRPPPTLPSGAAGQFVQTNDGATFLTTGYKAFVDIAPNRLSSAPATPMNRCCPASAVSTSRRLAVPAP